LPESIFGFVRAGVERADAYNANFEGFREISLKTRVLTGSTAPDTAVEIFGRRYAAPFGISPMGGMAFGRFRGDLEMAKAAATENIVLLLSGASAVPLEQIHRAAGTAWFQAYLPKDRNAAGALIARVAKSDYDVLVVTVDVPVGSNRFHYDRLGFSQPLRLTPRLMLDGLVHPRWLCGTALRTLLQDGVPHFENMSADRGGPMISASPQAMARAKLNWDDMAFLRDRWQGRLVVKGILSEKDAAKAAEVGIDGIVVSNHGGRQFDGAPAAIRVLPEIAAVAPTMTIMMDGGIRSGSDIMKAFALGAHFVFVGRPFYFANALRGARGVQHAAKLLKSELSRNMAMVGVDRISDLDGSFVGPGSASG